MWFKIFAFLSIFLIQLVWAQPPKVTDAFIQTYDNADAIMVRFSEPLTSKQNWQRFFHVTLGKRLQPKTHWILSQDGLKAIFPFVQPEQRYELRVKKGLRTKSGSKIAQAFSKTFTTKKITPFASFKDQGSVLTPKLKMALPVVTLNVDEVALDLFYIPHDQIKRWSYLATASEQRYYRLNEFAQANKMIYHSRFPIKNRANQRTVTNLDLSNIKALQQRGAYLAVLKVPGTYTTEYETTFFTVSDIGVQIRKNAKTMRVYTRSIATGGVKKDVVVELYSDKKRIAMGRVDDQGVVEFSEFASGQTLVAKQGDEMTVLRYDRNPLDLSAFHNVTARHFAQQVYAWSARDLYRPNEEVKLSALFRDFDGRSLSAVPLEVKLYDPTATLITTKVINPHQNSLYQFDFTLDKGAKTGKWRASFSLPGQHAPLHEYRFHVEEFVPERMALKLFNDDVKETPHIRHNENGSIPIQGDYLYGAPAAKNRVDGQLFVQLERHPFAHFKEYFFGIDGASVPYPRRAIMPSHLDANGSGTLPVDTTTWKSITSPLALNAAITLYEEGGRPITRSVTMVKFNRDRYVGIAPQFKAPPSEDSRPEFKLILSDDQGKQQSAKGYRLVFVKEDRNYYWRYNYSSGWGWHYDPLDYEVYSQALSFHKKSATKVSLPVEWGRYRVEVYNEANQLVNRYRFKTQWHWDSSYATKDLKPDRLIMKLDKTDYQAGDLAQLHLVAPTDGIVNLTIETNEQVLWANQINVKAKANTIALPIHTTWNRHDTYVTATLLTPGDMQHAVAPKRAFGLVHLPLLRKDANLALTIDAPQKIEPNQSLPISITLPNDHNSTQPIWVQLAAVDMGVLNITRFQTPDPSRYFFAPRRYETTLYDMYGQIIENAGFTYQSQRFGGDFGRKGDVTRAGEKAQSRVNIVALQTQPVLVDNEGKATVTLDIPQFNGALRLMAVAWSDDRYGSSDHEVKVVESIVTQLSKPRFLAVGDHATIGLSLDNQSEHDEVLSIACQMDGALGAKTWEQEVQLKQREKALQSFEVSALEQGEGNIACEITGKAIKPLKRTWQLPIRYAYAALTRKEQKVIEPHGHWQPAIVLGDLQSNSMSAQLTLSNQPPMDIQNHFNALLRYPYGCTEQSTSSGYPWVMLSPEIAKNLGLSDRIKTKFKENYTNFFRSQQIEKAVQRVLSRQVSTGGFALWSNKGVEEGWLSAYVTDFLVDAYQSGAHVPQGAMNSALKRLEQFVSDPTHMKVRYASNLDAYRFATQAYSAYVLAKANRGNLSHLRRVYDEVKALKAHSGLPWGHLAYALKRAGDEQLAQKAVAKANYLAYAKGYYGDYGSALRDSALLMSVLAQMDVFDGDQAIALFDQLKSRQWLSTQERNALFKAAFALQKGEVQVQASVSIADMVHEVDQKNMFSTLLDGEEVTGLKAIYSADGMLFGALTVVGHTKEAPKPVAQGLHIARRYFDLDGKEIDGKALSMGQMVVTQLKVRSDHTMPDALVVDLLPAGIELENQNLKNSSVNLSHIRIEGDAIDDWRENRRIEHIEFRDDRFVAALNLAKGSEETLYYLGRAVTAGAFVVPAPYAEDMYRPYYFGIGESIANLHVTP
jgi:uncharacterized protein YfaS (alpha-2-macroglobulin family)